MLLCLQLLKKGILKEANYSFLDHFICPEPQTKASAISSICVCHVMVKGEYFRISFDA